MPYKWFFTIFYWHIYFFSAVHFIAIEADSRRLQKSLSWKNFQELLDEFSDGIPSPENSKTNLERQNSNLKSLDLDQLGESIMLIGYQELVQQNLAKKDTVFIQINVPLIRKYEAFVHLLADYADSASKLEGSNINGVESLRVHDKLFALLLYARICKMLGEKIDQNQKKGKSIEGTQEDIEFAKNFLKKMRKTLLIRFEEQKRAFRRLLARDQAYLNTLILKNDQTLTREKSSRRSAFNSFIQMIRQISLRNQMEESFSRIMQKSANQHQFSEQKILEAVELNKKVILHLNEIVFGDYFYQTVRDQIHMSLMDNTKVFVDAQEYEQLFDPIYTCVNDASIIVLDEFMEQEEIIDENKNKFLNFIANLPLESFQKIFDLLISDPSLFLHRMSFKRSLKLANKAMANEDAEQLREYLDKLNGLGVENDKFAKTRFLANKFKTLHLYLLLYKSLFAQFFSGLDANSTKPKVPKSFDDSLSPEEYLAYWLITMSRALAKEHTNTRHELYKQLGRDFATISKLYASNLEKQMTPIRDEYNKLIREWEKQKRHQARKVRKMEQESKGAKALICTLLDCFGIGKRRREKNRKKLEQIEQMLAMLKKEKMERTEQIRENYEAAEKGKFEEAKRLSNNLADHLKKPVSRGSSSNNSSYPSSAGSSSNSNNASKKEEHPEQSSKGPNSNNASKKEKYTDQSSKGSNSNNASIKEENSIDQSSKGSNSNNASKMEEMLDPINKGSNSQKLTTSTRKGKKMVTWLQDEAVESRSQLAN